MNNLTPSLANPAKRNREKRYDCGSHGRLTKKQIASTAKITMGAVHYRIRRGVRGDELVADTRTLRIPTAVCRRPTIRVACKLVRIFEGKRPTYQDVMEAHPMSSRAAIHWAAALHEAQAVNPNLGLRP